MAQLQGAQTLAIILGASIWHNAPTLQASPAFRRSADAFRAYLQDPAACAVPAANVLWLFDTPDTPASLDTQLRTFLDTHVTPADSAITDLVCYYTGYGRVATPDNAFQLLLRTTAADAEAGSAYTLADFAQRVHHSARRLRTWLFLDCCAAAATSDDRQPRHDRDLVAMMHAELDQTLPRQRTAVFCASSVADVALGSPGGVYTRVSGALLAVLRTGSADLEDPMPLQDIIAQVDARLDRPEGDPAGRPHLARPDPQPGDLATVPVFPNPAASTPSSPRNSVP